MPPRDNETNQESDYEGLKGRFARQARQTIGGSTGPATRLTASAIPRLVV
jgi:hypothetical protein